MIAEVDETVKKLLTEKVPLNHGEVDVSFDMPDREWSASVSKPTVNLYLYDIRENHDLRNNEWARTRDNGIATRRKPPIRIDLSYLITVWTNDMADQHRLLGHILATLFRYSEIPDEVLADSLKDLEWPIRTFTAQPDGVLRNTSDFWSSLDNQLKPSVNYVVTIPIDLDVLLSAPEVRTRVFKFSGGEGKPPEEAIQISGIVRKRDAPSQVVPGATVLVKEAQMLATSDEEGKYTFRKLGYGSYTFKLSAPGEKGRQVKITVPSPNYDLDL